MIIDMQEGGNAAELDLNTWDVAFHGRVLDDRGEAAVEEIRRHAKHAYELNYDADNLEMNLNSTTVAVDDFQAQLNLVAKGLVALETTTLGFAEILLCCRAFNKIGIERIDFIYVEPEAYHSLFRGHLLHGRDFGLSEEVPGYRGIPGSTFFLESHSSHKCVFFLGYEESRLRRAFEDLQVIDPSKTNLVIGVPAFKPGWEMDLIANNITVIREQKICGGLHYCGADNPAAVLEVLSKIHQGLQSDERLFVAPIGTKPHGVGVALFVTEYPQVGVLYDHPRRSSGRSSNLGNWHLYTVYRNGEGVS